MHERNASSLFAEIPASLLPSRTDTAWCKTVAKRSPAQGKSAKP